MKKSFFSVLLVAFLLISLAGCENTNNNKNLSNSSDHNNITDNDNSTNTTSNDSNSKNNKYSLGDTFVFDGLELTFDTEYSFVTVQNRYSEHNGKSVIRLGVNVKNVSYEKNHLNMFSYDFFGSQGTELDGVSSYFDNAIDDAGDLKPGASYKAYFYILYDGDGKYSIDFDNYSQELSVEFNITK